MCSFSHNETVSDSYIVGRHKNLNDPGARKESLLCLARKIDIELEQVDENHSKNWDEAALTGWIRKKHKEFISKILTLFGFFMIVVSGIMAIWRSF